MHYLHLVNNINLLLNSILTSINRIGKRLQQKNKTGIESYRTGVKKKFTKVANMRSQRLKNKLAAYSHVLKNTFKNEKKLGFVYKSEILYLM